MSSTSHRPPPPQKNSKWLLCKIYNQETENENRDELDGKVCPINTDTATDKRREIECNCCAFLCRMYKKLRLGCADEEEDAFTPLLGNANA